MENNEKDYGMKDPIEENFVSEKANNEFTAVAVKKPIYKKWWFWLIIGLASITFFTIVLFGVTIATISNNSYNSDTSNSSTDETNNNTSTPNDLPSQEDKKNYKVLVSVTNKTNIPEDIYNGRYSNRVEFSFSIKNNEAKDIKGIKGILKIKDLFGNSILNINCDFTGKKIPKNVSTSFTNIGIDINQFNEKHTKLYSEKYSDLKFEYEILDVVYYGEQTVVQTTYDEVSIKVTDKTNIPEDIYNGRYSNRVEFDFSINNKCKKTIKGIEGVLIVKDLFGDEIIRINCDFTGKTISPNNSVSYTDLGIDINQFNDSHISIYNEKYADLNFEYVVETIVFSDGTSIQK